MKHISLLLFISILCIEGFSQDSWIDMMSNPHANFFETQKAFNDEMGKQNIPSHKHPKPFKRWEARMLRSVDDKGQLPEPGQVLNAYQDYVSTLGRSISGNWQPLGPSFNEYTIYGEIFGVGRLNTIAFHPTNENIMFAGSPSGGLWKTSDHGEHWEVLTDEMPTLGVSSIIIHPFDPDWIMIGTGDRDANDAPGLGTWLSTDGGLTWNASNTGMNNLKVNDLKFFPYNTQIIYAATSSGMFKSEDKGANWTRISPDFNEYKDFEFKPDNPNVIYATASFRLYISYDGGDNWTVIPSTTVPNTNRKLLAVSEDQPNYLYVMNCNQYDFHSLYRSVDSGQTFTLMANYPNILGRRADGSDTAAGQAWYDACIEVNPENGDEVIVGGINIWKSLDGGINWQLEASGGGQLNTSSIHVDQHYLEFNPLNNRLYLLNDGGIYFSRSINKDWENIAKRLVNTQLYKMGASYQDPYKVLTGSQDNGTSLFNGYKWRRVISADGMECYYDHTDDNYAFGTIQYGTLRRSMNGGNFDKIADHGFNQIDENEEGAWITPSCLNEINTNTIYIGYKDVWRCDNVRVQDRDDLFWQNISNGTINTTSCNVIEASPVDPELLLVTKGSQLFVSYNANDDSTSVIWNNISANLPGGGNINDLEFHPSDSATLYMVRNNAVYKTVDLGLNWTNINGSLPNVTFNCLVYDINTDEGLYIGTNAGVYYFNKVTGDWDPFFNGLPTAPEVTELEIYYGSDYPNDSRIRASTYGRGVWESDLIGNNGDVIPPIATIRSEQLIPEIFGEVTLTASFNKHLKNVSVTDFTESDIIIENATITNFQGGPADYSFRIAPINYGTVKVFIPKEVARDMEMQMNLASDTFKVVYSPDNPLLGFKGPGGVGDENSISLWLDASTGIFADSNANNGLQNGEKIGYWKDELSGNQQHAQQNIEDDKPRWLNGDNGISGMPAIDYDTTVGPEFLSAENIPIGKNLSVFAVAQSKSPTFYHHNWVASARTHNGFNLHVTKGGTNYYADAFDQNKRSIASYGTHVEDPTLPHIYGFTFRNTIESREITSHLDHIDKYRFIFNNFNERDDAGTTTIKFGHDYNDRFGYGKLGEFFMYNQDLNSAQLIIVKNYLASKYNIPLFEEDLYTYDTDFRDEVAGIGEMSKSMDPNNVEGHYEAKGTGILKLKMSEVDGLSKFLLWGHDNKGLDEWVDHAIPNTKRIARTWKFDESGSTGDIDLSVAKADLPEITESAALLVSSSIAFEDFSVYLLDDEIDELKTTFNPEKGDHLTIITGKKSELERLSGVYQGELGFDILPNPNNGNFSVRLNKRAIWFDIYLYSVNGKLIDQRPVGEALEFSYKGLSPGMYVVELKYNTVEKSKRVIVQ